MIAEMNHTISRINQKLVDLNLKKEEKRDSLSQCAKQVEANPISGKRGHERKLATIVKESNENMIRILTRHIYEIEAKIEVLEELKAESEAI
jgi:hypothetical protein